MEFKNQFMIWIGITVLGVLFVLRFKKKNKYEGGKKVAGISYIEEEPYFKKKVLQYKILSCVLVGTFVIGFLTSFFLLARPYKTVVTEKENYSRDIMLCIDVSDSVNELNMQLVEELKDTVENLKGERFGIVIFNASAVMLSPLTDDYAYIIELLDQIENNLKIYTADDYSVDDYFNASSYILTGTIVGAEERGSSLIGDGLATTVYDFPDLEEERTRIVIFSTDNELEGTPIVTLEEAANICQDNNVVVYGVGTKGIGDTEKKEMKAAVESTGGRFFQEEETGTLHEIVNAIEKEGKNLVKGKQQIRKIESVEVPMVILVISIFVMILVIKITKR